MGERVVIGPHQSGEPEPAQPVTLDYGHANRVGDACRPLMAR